MIEEYYPDETTDGRAIITTSCSSRDSLVGRDCLGLQIKPESFIKMCPFNKGLPLNAEMISNILKVHLPLGSNLGYSDAEKRNITSLCTGLGNNMQELLILGELLGSGLYSAETLCEYFANSMHALHDAPPSIWSLAFESLTPRSRGLLAVLSPLNSNMGVHRDLFKVSSLPEDLVWCMDDTE